MGPIILLAPGEVALDPIYDGDKCTVTFTEEHTLSDIVRYLLDQFSTPEAGISELRTILDLMEERDG